MICSCCGEPETIHCHYGSCHSKVPPMTLDSLDPAETPMVAVNAGDFRKTVHLINAAATIIRGVDSRAADAWIALFDRLEAPGESE